jgi:hypothetical protein
MKTEVIGYLPLRVRVLLHGLRYLLIPLDLIATYLGSEDLVERRPVRVPLTPGNFRNIFVLLQMRDETLDKIVLAENRLSLYLRPKRFLADPPTDKLSVFLFRLPPFPAELAQYPVRRETGMGAFFS